MALARPKTFLTGAGLVWRRQRVLWLIYVVTLLLAFLSTRGIVSRTAAVLDHSAEAEARLVHGFDLGAILELQEIPNSPLAGSNQIFTAPTVLSLIFWIFVTGGLLTVYYWDEALAFGTFFEACGEHFWRFLRLTIYFLIVMIPVGALAGVASALHARIDDKSVSPLTAVYFGVAAGVVILLLAMVARLWFDMAQVIAVAEEERAMHRALRRAAGLLARNFGSLFWLYFRISVVGTAVFSLALYFWMMIMRPEAIFKAAVLGQLMILWWIATRLWQHASEAKWYSEFRGMQSSRVPAPGQPLVSVPVDSPAVPA
ncbi:MAG TPA: hypothetical protein VMJ93_16880 [Verrucomicrobiae bacterium]|nr:hypothetical protein [Verrucomicrobiae bacterium]